MADDKTAAAIASEPPPNKLTLACYAFSSGTNGVDINFGTRSRGAPPGLATPMAVKYFAWDDATLKADRGIELEDVVFHIERGDLLDILEHPNLDRR